MSPPPVSFSRPLTTCRYSLRSPRLFSIQSHRFAEPRVSFPRCSTSFLFKRLVSFSLSLSLSLFLSFSRLVATIFYNVPTLSRLNIFRNVQHEFLSAFSLLFFYSPCPFFSSHPSCTVDPHKTLILN